MSTQNYMAPPRVLSPERIADLRSVVSRCAPRLPRLIGDAIELHTEFQTETAWVSADPEQMEQILRNLALNARDAMPSGGTLTIRLTAEPDDPSHTIGDIALEVRDTGVGMHPETLARAFEPFFTTKPGSRGLGLAMVDEIVRKQAGRIEVDSAPGLGATFRIFLPRLPEPPLRDIPRRALQAETVLLVESDPSVRGPMCYDLEVDGYTVLEAADPAEALQRAWENTGPIDLLVSDVAMPRMSGSALFEILAARHPGLRVLFVAGAPDETAFSSRALVMPKPFSRAELLRHVRGALGRERKAWS